MKATPFQTITALMGTSPVPFRAQCSPGERVESLLATLRRLEYHTILVDGKPVS